MNPGNAASASAPGVVDVTVVLGDPNLPDNAKRTGRFEAEDFEAFARLKEALAALPGFSFTYLEDHMSLISTLAAARPRFVLNFCDTGYRNHAPHELHVPALLEVLGIAYSGSGPTCLGLCYDKALVRGLARSLSVPVPLETYVHAGESFHANDIAYPALVKPNSADGSVGITRDSVVHDAAQAVAYLERLQTELPGRDALVQEYLTGGEYSLGLIGNPGQGFIALPMLEVDYSELPAGLPHILCYESKADPASPYWSQVRYREARIDDTTRQCLQQYSEKLFARLDCRDCARFDFRADSKGEIRLLEVNPNPAWCWDGKLNIMAGIAGFSYSQFLEMLLKAALGRIEA
ncbi:MAG: D-alanine--D-alanine ligase family protein [Gammaproteobacteria bacterium]